MLKQIFKIFKIKKKINNTNPKPSKHFNKIVKIHGNYYG